MPYFYEFLVMQLKTSRTLCVKRHRFRCCFPKHVVLFTFLECPDSILNVLYVHLYIFPWSIRTYILIYKFILFLCTRLRYCILFRAPRNVRIQLDNTPQDARSGHSRLLASFWHEAVTSTQPTSPRTQKIIMDLWYLLNLSLNHIPYSLVNETIGG